MGTIADKVALCRKSEPRQYLQNRVIANRISRWWPTNNLLKTSVCCYRAGHNTNKPKWETRNLWPFMQPNIDRASNKTFIIGRIFGVYIWPSPSKHSCLTVRNGIEIHYDNHSAAWLHFRISRSFHVSAASAAVSRVQRAFGSEASV